MSANGLNPFQFELYNLLYIFTYMHQHPMVLGVMFLFGACFGSFFHLVAHRFLAEKSIIAPSSHCSSCQKELAWYDNIPIVSYCILMGKCRNCGVRYGIDSVVTEIITGVLFAAIIYFCGFSWQALFLLFLVSNLVIITLTDLKESLIFQINSLTLIPAGLVYSFFNLGDFPTWVHAPIGPVFTIPLSFADIAIQYPIASAFLGIALAFVFFEGIIFLSRMFLGTDGFGHGDTHLMMGVGAYLGWEQMGIALLFGFILQSILAIPMLLVGWVKKGQWNAIITGVFSVVFALMPLFADMVSAVTGLNPFTVVLISAGGALVSLLFFLRQLRHQTEYVYIPLGPALVLGTLIVLFANLIGRSA